MYVYNEFHVFAAIITIFYSYVADCGSSVKGDEQCDDTGKRSEFLTPAPRNNERYSKRRQKCEGTRWNRMKARKLELVTPSERQACRSLVARHRVNPQASQSVHQTFIGQPRSKWSLGTLEPRQRLPSFQLFSLARDSLRFSRALRCFR